MLINECSALFVKRLWGLIKPPTLQLHDSELHSRKICARQRTAESKCFQKLGNHAIIPFTFKST